MINLETMLKEAYAQSDRKEMFGCLGILRKMENGWGIVLHMVPSNMQFLLENRFANEKDAAAYAREITPTILEIIDRLGATPTLH